MDVFIDRCEDYNEAEKVIQRAFEALGGVDRFVKNGEKILLNPNLLKGESPDKAVTTHPEFIRAIINILEKKDIDIIVGDSPAGKMTEKKLKKIYSKCGWLDIEYDTTANLNFDLKMVNKKLSGGIVKKNFKIMKIVEEVDGIINIPKLKTHSLTVFTGAVKNQFGLIHGLNKSAYHGKFKTLNKFSKMLLDLNDLVESRLSIMDGILAMEGDGPSGGSPIKLDSVLASPDPVACDWAACKLAGIPPQKISTLTESDLDQEDINYINRNPSSFDKNIEYPSGGKTPGWVPSILADIFANFYLDRPHLLKDKCDTCWVCQEVCPEDAIKKQNYGPKISWWKCIRCYCCTEACPEDALNVE